MSCGVSNATPIVRKATDASQAMFETERKRTEERLEQVESDKSDLQTSLKQYEATVVEMVARENSTAMAKHSDLESVRSSMKADPLDSMFGESRHHST